METLRHCRPGLHCGTSLILIIFLSRPDLVPLLHLLWVWTPLHLPLLKESPPLPPRRSSSDHLRSKRHLTLWTSKWENVFAGVSRDDLWELYMKEMIQCVLVNQSSSSFHELQAFKQLFSLTRPKLLPESVPRNNKTSLPGPSVFLVLARQCSSGF